MSLPRGGHGQCADVSTQHPTQRGEPGQRGRFDQVAETASNLTSSPAFFAFCVLLIVLWLATHVIGLSTHWQHLAGDAMAAVTLLLLALLKNSELRAEHAVQRKLDAIAAALLEQRDGKSTRAQADLEQAIGMHEEV